MGMKGWRDGWDRKEGGGWHSRQGEASTEGQVWEDLRGVSDSSALGRWETPEMREKSDQKLRHENTSRVRTFIRLALERPSKRPDLGCEGPPSVLGRAPVTVGHNMSWVRKPHRTRKFLLAFQGVSEKTR